MMFFRDGVLNDGAVLPLVHTHLLVLLVYQEALLL